MAIFPFAARTLGKSDWMVRNPAPTVNVEEPACQKKGALSRPRRFFLVVIAFMGKNPHASHVDVLLRQGSRGYEDF